MKNSRAHALFFVDVHIRSKLEHSELIMGVANSKAAIIYLYGAFPEILNDRNTEKLICKVANIIFLKTGDAWFRVEKTLKILSTSGDNTDYYWYFATLEFG